MTMLSSLTTLSIVAICSYAQFEPPEECRFVRSSETVFDTDELEAYAMEVCRKVVTNGNAEYKYWKCDSTGDLFEHTYATEGCTGNPTSIDRVNVGAPVRSASCVAGGDRICTYVMMKQPCNNPTDYEEFPIITDKCNLAGSFESFWWTCTDTTVTDNQAFDSVTCDGDIDPTTLAIDGTECHRAVNGFDYSPISGCLQITYTPQPTVAPTTDPTMEPTTDPTPNPTEPTMEPTLGPSEATESPTGTPTASPEDEGTPESASFINIITNCIFVIFLVSFINFV